MANKGFTVKVDIDFKRLNKAIAVASESALEKTAVQMMDWNVNGSPAVPESPPIRTGFLRGSTSAFVGKKLVGTSGYPVTGGSAAPATSYNGKNKVITVGFNAAYATKMHEDKSLRPGAFSQQAGSSNPGNQWAMRHAKGDAKASAQLIAKLMEKKL